MNDDLATRIERYLEGQLSPEERTAFEAEVQKDQQLALEMHLHRAARLAVRMQSALDRRDRLQESSLRLLHRRLWWWKTQDFVEDTFAQLSPQGAWQPRWGRLALAGLSVLLLVLGVWQLAHRTQKETETLTALNTPQALFEAYFSPVELSHTLGAPAEDSYERARQLYAQRECAQALPLLDEALANPAFVARPTALLLKGTCLLEAGHIEAAIAALESIPPTAKIPHQQAEWYLALAYLKANQQPQAIQRLKSIAQQPRHLYSEKARAILELEPK